MPDGLSLFYSVPESGVYCVRGIEARLGQVWCNLIDNALSFSPKGGTVRLDLALKERFITLIVEDEGPGLPEGAESRIFERFYSERPSGEPFGRHSGLGLSISKQIIEAHGGTIEAANRSALWYQDFAAHMDLPAWEFADAYIRRGGRIDDARLRNLAPRFMSGLEAYRAGTTPA